MSACHAALVITGAHMEMAVILAIHGADGAGQGDNLIPPLKLVSLIGLFDGIKDPNCKVIHRTQPLDGGKTNPLCQRNSPDLL